MILSQSKHCQRHEPIEEGNGVSDQPEELAVYQVREGGESAAQLIFLCYHHLSHSHLHELNKRNLMQTCVSRYSVIGKLGSKGPYSLTVETDTLSTLKILLDLFIFNSSEQQVYFCIEAVQTNIKTFQQ